MIDETDGEAGEVAAQPEQARIRCGDEGVDVAIDVAGRLFVDDVHEEPVASRRSSSRTGIVIARAAPFVKKTSLREICDPSGA